MKKEDNIRVKLFGAVFAVLFLIFLGSIVYHNIEEWSWIDSAYFTVMTLTTIGFGDLVPTHDASKIFTIFFAFSGVGVFLYAMTVVARHYVKYRIGVIENAVKRVGVKAIEKFSPDLKPPSTRRGYVKQMTVRTKEAMRKRREEALKKKAAKKK